LLARQDAAWTAIDQSLASTYCSKSMPSREYSKLVEALRLCALPYEGQAGALPTFVFVPDEVVLEFDAAYRAASKAGRLRALGAFVDRDYLSVTDAESIGRGVLAGNVRKLHGI